MKLYTRGGDDGSTSLLGGQRVHKDALRVQTYGTVDELNSILGLAAADCHFDELTQLLHDIQSRLFEIGADLAAPRPADEAEPQPAIIARVDQRQVDEVERQIDGLCDKLEPLEVFILPGGTELAARLHVARAVCRRAERLCVSLAQQEPIGDFIIVYLNRISDLLFAMARRANQLAGVEDVPWQRRR